MGETLDKAALTAAEAVSKLLASLSIMVDKMTTLMFQGGMGLGRLVEAGINKADLLITEYGTYNMPPSPDEQADIFRNAENPKKTFAYLTYCELVYGKRLEETETPIDNDLKELERLESLKESSVTELPFLSMAIDDKQAKLQAAERERDNHYPGTDGLYEHFDKEVKEIREKELYPLVGHYNKTKAVLHDSTYMMQFDDVMVSVSLDTAISQLKNSIDLKQSKTKQLRKNYELAANAKRQYEERLEEERRDIPNEIKTLENKKKNECNNDSACIVDCNNAIAELKELQKKNKEDLDRLSSLRTEAYEAFNKTISKTPPAPTEEKAEEQKPVKGMQSLKGEKMPEDF